MPYYRRNLFVLWIATFLAAASYQQVVPFLPLFLTELGVKSHLNQWASIVFAAHFVSAIYFQPFWGRIADQVGRKPMMIRAGVCLSLIYIGMSFSTAAWQIAFCRFLNGALTGFIPGAVALCATNTPKQWTARYVASLQTANAAGTIIGPAIGGMLADLFGFRGALRASGVTVFVCTVLVILLVQEKNKVRIRHDTSLWQDAVLTVRHPVLLTVMLTVAFTAFGTTAMQPMLAVYLNQLQQGGPNWLSGAVFSLPGLAFVVTASLWTRLGEKKGFGKIIPIGLLWAGAASVTLSFTHNLVSFSIFYFLLGAFVAILRPSASALIALRVEDNMQGLAYGMQQSAFMIGGLAGPVFAGFVGFLGTRWIFSWIGICLVLGAWWLRGMIFKWDAAEPNKVSQAAASLES